MQILFHFWGQQQILNKFFHIIGDKITIFSYYTPQKLHLSQITLFTKRGDSGIRSELCGTNRSKKITFKDKFKIAMDLTTMKEQMKSSIFLS